MLVIRGIIKFLLVCLMKIFFFFKKVLRLDVLRIDEFRIGFIFVLNGRIFL